MEDYRTRPTENTQSAQGINFGDKDILSFLETYTTEEEIERERRDILRTISYHQDDMFRYMELAMEAKGLILYYQDKLKELNNGKDKEN